MEKRNTRCQCVRCREVRGKRVEVDKLILDDLVYRVGGTEEHFLSFVSPHDKLVGFLRLSLPTESSPAIDLEDLTNAAIIREVHVYGQSLQVGEEQKGAAQHTGLGTKLIDYAERIARQKGFSRLAVISAVGTRNYYLQRGFYRGELYLVNDLT
jgi:elongator complex protein 3